MASLPCPLNRQDTHGRVGTARTPYPPTMSEKPCSSVFQSQRGFKSIGYHFVVRLDGEVERGRFPNAEIRGHRDYAAKDYSFLSIESLILSYINLFNSSTSLNTVVEDTACDGGVLPNSANIFLALDMASG